MTTMTLLPLLFACHTTLFSKGDTAGHDLDSVDTVETGVDSEDSGCVPETEIPYDNLDQDCNGADLTDVDGDGYDASDVGGDDCLDTNGAIHPGATDIAYDTIDQDCSGADLTDVDGDGYDATAVGGDDCLDTDSAINPGATEIPYDGIDQDCSGADLTDVDRDGYDATAVGGGDCVDNDGTIHPGAHETPYDGVDQDCSGADLTDVDGDGHEAPEVGGDDCVETDATIHPGAAETPYDDVDQDCSGLDLTDVDGDGHDATEVGGVDCLDTDPAAYPGATETPYDGIDQDCSGADLADVDGDGYDAAAVGGDDCSDTDVGIHPDATDTAYDGIDQDCSGADLTDVDGDGHDALVVGGDDCDDDEATAYPGATEIPYDGIDQDCSGADLTDVDGDGYESDAVGGDDCDDADATANPGAMETRGDSADNDCDGRPDEYVTCWDGTGDFLTVQEGIDGTPDGGTLEICSGTYTELVTITDRVLTVEGDDPLGVLISWNFEGDYSRVVTVEGDSEVTISSLGIEASGYCLYSVTERVPVAVDIVDFSGCLVPLLTAGAGAMPAGVTVDRSHFAGNAGGYSIVGGVQTIIRRSAFLPEPGTHVWFDATWGSKILFENNLVVGGDVLFLISASTFVASQNTFADTSALRFYDDIPDWDPPLPLATIAFTNNIFSQFRVIDGTERPLWDVYWVQAGTTSADTTPQADNNLFYDSGASLAQVTSAIGDSTLDTTMTADSEAALLASAILADPEFSAGPMGSYGLAVTSPAIDAGTGDPDPDGTPADLGAFGGPNANWWMEVPWPLP